MYVNQDSLAKAIKHLFAWFTTYTQYTQIVPSLLVELMAAESQAFSYALNRKFDEKMEIIMTFNSGVFVHT
jgi:hypothetical protein